MTEISQQQAQQWIEEEIHCIYRRLQQGKDVSPSQHLYLEGQVKLLFAFKVIDYPWLKSTVNRLYQQYFDCAIDEVFWHWAESESRFYLPIKMQQAPVYKG